jgi:hypothetical protein
MKYGEKVQVIHIIQADQRILCDGAFLTPRIFEFYKTQLTQSELKSIQFESIEVVYVGHNVVQYRHDLLGEDHERNVFHLPNGETVHN